MRWGIAWRSVRWRAGSSAVMVAVATVGIAAGTFGPLYLHGADQSVLQATLRSAPAGDTGLTLLADDDRVTAGQLYRAAGLAPRAPNGRALYGNPIVTVDRPVSTVSTRDGQAYGADLISRTGICRDLSFAAGSCPCGRDEVALSTEARLVGPQDDGSRHPRPPPRRHHGGPADLGLFPAHPMSMPAYRWGANYFGFGFGSPSTPELDDFVTTQARALSITARGRAPLLGQLPLLGACVRTDDCGDRTVVGPVPGASRRSVAHPDQQLAAPTLPDRRCGRAHDGHHRDGGAGPAGTACPHHPLLRGGPER